MKMEALIVYKSKHHMNTEKVAKAMAEVLGARLVKPEEIDPALVATYDLIGFGSGIYWWKHDAALLEFARKIPKMKKGAKSAFVFSTSGSGKCYHNALLDILLQRGFIIKGQFNCAGFDTVGPLKFIGGIKKGHPDANDLENARAFAKFFDLNH